MKRGLKTIVVPNHSGKMIGKGLLVSILKKELGISRDKFEELRK